MKSSGRPESIAESGGCGEEQDEEVAINIEEEPKKFKKELEKTMEQDGRTGAQIGCDSSDFGRIPCLTKSDLIKWACKLKKADR